MVEKISSQVGIEPGPLDQKASTNQLSYRGSYIQHGKHFPLKVEPVFGTYLWKQIRVMKLFSS